MKKYIIEYNGKKFQLSTTILKNYCSIIEIMIFPIEDGIVSGSEIFCHRTLNPTLAAFCCADIRNNPEKFLNEEAIQKYKNQKEKMFE